jgi:hypothetical protein
LAPGAGSWVLPVPIEGKAVFRVLPTGVTGEKGPFGEIKANYVVIPKENGELIFTLKAQDLVKLTGGNHVEVIHSGFTSIVFIATKVEVATPAPAPSPKPATVSSDASVPPPPASVQKTESSVPAKPPTSYLITTKGCNIRSEANSNSKIIKTLNKGEKLEKTGKSGNWINVKLSSGQTGWVHKDLVKEVP